MADPAMTLGRAQARLLARLADGLDVLIRFHDREVDADLVRLLRRHGVAAGLQELAASDAAQDAVQALEVALAAIGDRPDPALLDELAAEFADLYLTHGYRVAPSGSVWMTEDRLERQLPMFEVRDWYAQYDITVPDWRRRADDHLVHELQFLSFLLRRGDTVAAQDAGRFMDLHVLPWVPEFCRRAGDRLRQPLYRAVMVLTRAYLDELRGVLEDLTGQARAVRLRPEEATADATAQPDATPYVPGLAESW